MAFVRAGVIAAIAAAALLAAVPASAQFSDSYTFLKAVRDQDVAKARALLDKPGTVVNSRDGGTGEAPLHIVVRRRDTPWLGFLLQANADVDIRDRDGNTPLLLAASTGYVEGVRVLIAVGARVDLKNNAGETALIKAVHARDTDTAKMLLDAGANPDIHDNAQGYSARDYALQDARGGAMARLLKDAKARSAAPVQGPSL